MSSAATVLAIVVSLIGATMTPARAESPPPDMARRGLFPVAAPAPTPPPLPEAPPLTTMHRKRTAPLIAGAVLFGLSWGGAVFLSAALINCRCTSGDRALSFSFPVLGPVMGGPPADGSIWYLWSAAQLGGALLLGYGIKGEDVPVTRERAVHTVSLTRPELQLTPMVARDARGLALTGRW